jgi:hypothetical protein
MRLLSPLTALANLNVRGCRIDVEGVRAVLSMFDNNLESIDRVIVTSMEFAWDDRRVVVGATKALTYPC